MLIDVTTVKTLPDFRLELTFEDGTSGVFDMSGLVGGEGVFGPLQDPAYFRRARVDPDSGTVVWPNGADVCPDVLYAAVTGEPIEESSEPVHRRD